MAYTDKQKQFARKRHITGYKKGIAGFFLAAIVVVASFAVPVSAAFPGLNGRIVFHSDRDGDNEVYTMRLDGTDVRQLTFNNENETNASWSPDGTKIAFRSDREAGEPEIYIMNADGSNQTRVTDGTIANDTWPAWSYDGTKLLFSSNRSGNYEIYTINLNGTGLTNLTNHVSSDLDSAWSPDGTKIVFRTARIGGSETHIMNADGTNPIRLTDSAGVNQNTFWSPDGARLGFYSDRTGNYELYLMNPDGTNQVNVSNDPGMDLSGDFLPDGSKIIFRSDRSGDSDIYLMNPDSTGLVNITNLPGSTDSGPSVQPLTTLPTINPDTAPAVKSGDSVTVDVLSNDRDTYESIDPTTLSIVSVSNGTATANSDSTITYQSVLGYSGTAEVTYRVCSTANNALCNTGTLSVTVTSSGQLAATGESGMSLALVALGIILLSIFRMKKVWR